MENNSPGGLCSANATATSSVIEYKAEEEMRLLKWKDAVGPKRPPQVQSLCDPGTNTSSSLWFTGQPKQAGKGIPEFSQMHGKPLGGIMD